VSSFVQQSLPSNYQTVLTPYDTARTLHRAVMKALTYNDVNAPYVDAVGVLQAGQAECSGFSALLTACLRNVGIPARPISGNWEGVGHQGHVRVEFNLPGAGWLLADPTEGQANDPTGTYAYYFGYVPDANTFLATDVGDNHVMPANYQTPFNNFYFPFIGTGPNWWWDSGGAAYTSYNGYNLLQPNGVLSPTNSPVGSIQFYLSDVPSEGTVVVQTSTNLRNWSPVVTNSATGSVINYSFPVTNGASIFYRANVIP
jgi:transglutaminase-like putative cysteine protease